MPIEQFESKIKENFDMVIFTPLLEMNHEETFDQLYKLYAHVEMTINAINENGKAL
jgi:hypothetical protein